MTAKLYVVHHSRTLVTRAIHSSQLPLSQVGVMVATPLAEASFWREVGAIYSSPELPAAQTAELIAQRWQLPLFLEDDLCEMWLVAPGLSEIDLLEVIGDHLEGHISSPLLEGYSQAQGRVVRFVEQMAQENKGRSLAIVTHARLIVALYSHIMRRRLRREDWLSLRMPDLSVIDLATWQVVDGFFS